MKALALASALLREAKTMDSTRHSTTTAASNNSALREAVLNALVHRNYAVGAPIQIRVYADRLLAHLD